MQANSRFLDDFVQQLAQRLNQLGLRENIEPLVRTAAESALSRLDLVTRTEFDVQVAKLARAEQQLAELEQQLQELLNRDSPG